MDGILYFSVGEPSGDLHASNLIRSLNQHLSAPDALSTHTATDVRPQDPIALRHRGLGGPQMAAAGCAIDYELTNLAVVGMVEVLPKLREFFRVADLAEAALKRERPDAVVLVDFPGFNWHIAKRAHRQGIPVIYYLPPQLWAWGAWRLGKLKRTVDHVLCNLPFEPQWYAERNVEVEYVGHPFFDEVYSRPLDREFIAEQTQHGSLNVAVLPGSRTREVDKIWPMQLAAIRELSARHRGVQFKVAGYRQHHIDMCKQHMTAADQRLPIEFFVGKTSELIELADCALMKSGSVSLEMMARHTPAVVTYHASRTFYALGRCLTRLNSMTLPNMIAGEVVMPEFLGVGSPTKAIGQVIGALDRLLADRDARQEQAAKLKSLADRYAQPGASQRAAAAIARRIYGRSSPQSKSSLQKINAA